MERAAATTLIVDEPGAVIANHDIAGLEIPVHEMFGAGFQNKSGERPEIAFEPRLAERDVRQLEEVVLEVVQIPLDGLAVERLSRICDAEVHGTATHDLKPRELLEHALVESQCCVREEPPLGLSCVD